MPGRRHQLCEHDFLFMSAERLAVPNHLDEEKQEKLNRDLRVNINILGILQNNNLEEIRKLLEAGADANGIPRGYSVPPLSDVVLLRSTNVVECAELLLEHGADPNGGSHRHSFPLLQLISESSLHGHLMRVVPLVKLLLRHGAKVGRDAPVPDWSSWSIVQKARNYMNLHEIRAHNPHLPIRSWLCGRRSLHCSSRAANAALAPGRASGRPLEPLLHAHLRRGSLSPGTCRGEAG